MTLQCHWYSTSNCSQLVTKRDPRGQAAKGIGISYTIDAAVLRAKYAAVVGAVLHYDGTVGIHLCGRLPASCNGGGFRQYQMRLICI